MQEVGVITKIKQNTPTKFSHYNINSFITSHLLGRILIMVMYFLINQTKKVYAKKNESVQDNAALPITDAITCTSQMKLYNKLGLESLKFRSWFRKL